MPSIVDDLQVLLINSPRPSDAYLPQEQSMQPITTYDSAETNGLSYLQ